MMAEQTENIEFGLPEYVTLPLAMQDRLPKHTQHWNVTASHSGHRNNIDRHFFTQTLQNTSQYKSWKWPKKRLYIITDPHADAEAFVASLIISGGVIKTGSQLLDFKLTKAGKKGIFIIAGDCLDKGPSNLELLDSVRQLFKLKANVKLLAGNHDMRLFMGIQAMGLQRDPKTEHLFVRMGDKVLPLIREVYDRYLKGKKLSKHIPDEDECKKRLFPNEHWAEQFSDVAKSLMTPAGIERELSKMAKKINHFEKSCHKAGFSLREIYATALQCRQLFLHPKGDYAWFYKDMELAYRKGSFLFIHAGLDDGMSRLLVEKGIRYINKQFRHDIKKDLFQFYFGSMANTMRTKYRPADLPLTGVGVEQLTRSGYHAIVQGHINRKHGQRLAIKRGLLHIECDVTLDQNSRIKEGLTGKGMGVTIVDPAKYIMGVSSDYPYAKVFEPESYLTQKAQEYE